MNLLTFRANSKRVKGSSEISGIEAPSIHHGGGGVFDGPYTRRPDLSLRCVHKPPPSRTGLTPKYITIIYTNV
jgi:hypothetical protein